MPTEARGSYLPEPPYLRETKTIITASHPSRHNMTTCWQLFRPDINTAHFYFVVAEVNMSNYLTTDGLKKFSLLPDRHVSRRISRQPPAEKNIRLSRRGFC